MLNRMSNKEVRGPTFSVVVPDVHRVQFFEGDRVAIVEVEGGRAADGKVDWVIYSQTLTSWEPPHQADELSLEKHAEMLGHISNAFDLLGMPHRII